LLLLFLLFLLLVERKLSKFKTNPITTSSAITTTLNIQRPEIKIPLESFLVQSILKNTYKYHHQKYNGNDDSNINRQVDDNIDDSNTVYDFINTSANNNNNSTYVSIGNSSQHQQHSSSKSSNNISSVTLVQAIENLEDTLKDMNLFIVDEFPTFNVINKLMMEIFKITNTNQKLLAELLTYQFILLYPSIQQRNNNYNHHSTTTSNNNNSTINSKQKNDTYVNSTTTTSTNHDRDNREKINTYLFNPIDEINHENDELNNNDNNINNDDNSNDDIHILSSPSIIPTLPPQPTPLPSSSRRQSFSTSSHSKRSSFIIPRNDIIQSTAAAANTSIPLTHILGGSSSSSSSYGSRGVRNKSLMVCHIYIYIIVSITYLFNHPSIYHINLSYIYNISLSYLHISYQ